MRKFHSKSLKTLFYSRLYVSFVSILVLYSCSKWAELPAEEQVMPFETAEDENVNDDDVVCFISDLQLVPRRRLVFIVTNTFFFFTMGTYWSHLTS